MLSVISELQFLPFKTWRKKRHNCYLMIFLCHQNLLFYMVNHTFHWVICLSLFLILCSILVFELVDKLNNFISSFCERSPPLLPPSWGFILSSQGVELADGEPGEGSKHKDEQVLANMGHDAFILKDALLHIISGKETNIKHRVFGIIMKWILLSGPNSKIPKP